MAEEKKKVEVALVPPVTIGLLDPFGSEPRLKDTLNRAYKAQLTNLLGNEKKALRFLSSVVAATQRNPKLLQCTSNSVINSFMTMAQLDLMPSDVSGEAYVIPYNNSKKISENGKDKWIKVLEAQFQLGYQGLVTLFYRAGVLEIIAEIVRKNDKFSYINGVIHHEQDVFSDRGEAIGAYTILKLGTGGAVSKAMSKEEILKIASTFSKSFKTDDSPWKEGNDPQLWMWRKTVLKQAAKLVPKNEKLIQAIDEDNRDSVIGDRLEGAKELAPALKMGHILKDPANPSENAEEEQAPSKEDGDQTADGSVEESD